MAARENQGLQIALIVFVMLTIMLSVATFLSFRNFQGEQQRAKAAEEKASNAEQGLSKLQGEHDTLMQYVGHAASESPDAVTKAYEDDFANAVTLGLTNLPDDQKNYRALVTNYQELTKTQNAQLVKKDQDLTATKATLAQKTQQFADEIAKLAAEKDQTIAEYIAERKRITDQNKELTETKNRLITEKEAKDKAFAELKAKTDAEIASLKDQLATSATNFQRVNKNYLEVTSTYNVGANPDGRILWVNQREGTAVINLGSADNLRKRITFSVYDPSTTDVSAYAQSDSKVATPASAAVAKGSIEVININDRHLAECRILQHSPSNPIVPGDVIYTPVWQPGQQERFAIVGMVDIDGDGVDDGQRVREVIQLNGGTIDDEVSVNTRYLVVGKIQADAENVDDNNRKLKDAQEFGVQHIQVGQLLQMMGYSSKAAEGNIAPGEGPRHPKAGEPTARFRPRNPPPRANPGVR